MVNEAKHSALASAAHAGTFNGGFDSAPSSRVLLYALLAGITLAAVISLLPALAVNDNDSFFESAREPEEKECPNNPFPDQGHVMMRRAGGTRQCFWCPYTD